jgi:hypothetical protein
MFPVEPGIFSIFPLAAPFARENGKANQPLVGQFP